MAQVKTEQEMFPLVEGWLSSGLTQKQFCITHQMPIHILAYWVGRYLKSQPAKTAVDKGEATTGKNRKKVIASESSSGFIRLSPPAPISTPAPADSSLLPTTQLPTGNIEVVFAHRRRRGGSQTPT